MMKWTKMDSVAALANAARYHVAAASLLPHHMHTYSPTRLCILVLQSPQQ